MNDLIVSQTSSLAKALSIESTQPGELASVLKSTAFKGNVSDAQMIALLVVANQYKLNPWTKEIYAFPDRQNGIVPVVGVDGWSRIINSHDKFDGMDFEQNDESCTCIIYRKDRSHPVRVTEYMAECRREVGPWKSHPRRMLRHKAMIQCARLAFGFVGIYEQDEADRIIDAQAVEVPRDEPKQLPAYADDEFKALLPDWKALIESGKTNAKAVIDKVSTKHTLTAQQIAEINKCQPVDAEVVDGELVEETA